MSSTVIDWTSCFPVEPKKVEEYRPTIGQKVTFGLSSAVAGSSLLFKSSMAYAATAASVIPDAFDPVKDLLISLAEPLCYVMFVWGCIEVICKRPASGLDRMKYAAIGFIGINFIPVLMDVIKQSAPQ